jgi:hypothetical protein
MQAAFRTLGPVLATLRFSMFLQHSLMSLRCCKYKNGCTYWTVPMVPAISTVKVWVGVRLNGTP